MDIKEWKETIRERLLEIRSSIPEQEFLQKSAEICDRLQGLSEYRNAEIIHCYVSINERREVNTHPLLSGMLAAGKKVIVPITQISNGTLRHVELKSINDLKANEWGMLEPADGEEVAVETLDLVIVPMAGGDRQKNRIGYGKGFYDRFLAQVECPSVGLLFEEGLIEDIPTEPFDVPLDILVTEDRIN
jgi:5-formyltetrahydrofolate cyclo-ligase